MLGALSRRFDRIEIAGDAEWIGLGPVHNVGRLAAPPAGAPHPGLRAPDSTLVGSRIRQDRRQKRRFVVRLSPLGAAADGRRRGRWRSPRSSPT